MVTLAAESLSVRLGDHKVVEGLDLDLAPGAFIGVIGPNGAGKSTLLRALLGLLPLDAGRVLLDGDDLAALPRPTIARRLAYLAQGQTVHWPVSVERLVALGRLPHLAPFSRIGADDRRAIDAAMARADVAHLAGRTVTDLSGGERARVLLARALAVEAPGLLVDEPLAALDPGHQIDVMRLLADEARRGGLVVAVLHDLGLAARHCDRLVLMDEGRLVADGAPEAVLTPARLAEVYGVSAHIGRAGDAALVVPLDRAPPPKD